MFKDMKPVSRQLEFFLRLARVNAILARSFNRGLGCGIGFTDFTILYHLSTAPGSRMRRVDLAEKVALTASGVTRLLLPMEKIGLVKREDDPNDGRVSYVKLAPGGKRLLEEAMEEAEMICEEYLPSTKARDVKDLTDIFTYLKMGQVI
jgi:DNA-binding MarR family transcriptional regulator